MTDISVSQIYNCQILQNSNRSNSLWFWTYQNVNSNCIPPVGSLGNSLPIIECKLIGIRFNNGLWQDSSMRKLNRWKIKWLRDINTLTDKIELKIDRNCGHNSLSNLRSFTQKLKAEKTLWLSKLTLFYICNCFVL